MPSRTSQICMVGVMLLALVSSGCVSTKLVYNPNVYQTGRVQSGSPVKFRTSLEGGPTIVTEPDERTVVTHTPSADQSASLMFGLHRSLAARTDLGLDATLGTSLAFRGYAKTQITPVDRTFAASLMPALVYVSGTSDEDDDTGEQLNSWLVGAEFHVPMSYALSRLAELTWTPKLLGWHYDAAYTNQPPQESHLPVSATRSVDIAALGFAAGFRFGILRTEASVTYLLNEPDDANYRLDNPFYTFGLAFHP